MREIAEEIVSLIKYLSGTASALNERVHPMIATLSLLFVAPASAFHLFGASRRSIVDVPTRSIVDGIRCSGSDELAWRRKQSEGKSAGAAAAKAEDQEASSSAPSGVYSDALMKAKGSQRPNLSTSVDDMNFFGAVGGGTLSRESIANAQKTSSPRIDAMEALQAAVKGGTATAESLSKVIGDAYVSLGFQPTSCRRLILHEPLNNREG